MCKMYTIGGHVRRLATMYGRVKQHCQLVQIRLRLNKLENYHVQSEYNAKYEKQSQTTQKEVRSIVVRDTCRLELALSLIYLFPWDPTLL